MRSIAAPLLLMLAAACGQVMPPSGTPNEYLIKAEKFIPYSFEELSKMRTPMPGACAEAMAGRYEITTMVGQSTDPDVGGVGFTGHSPAERTFATAVNAEIGRINAMVGDIREQARGAMRLQGLPENMADGDAPGMAYYKLPTRHLDADEIDQLCQLFDGFTSERSRRRAEREAIAICKMMGEPPLPGQKHCIGGPFK